MLSKSCAVVLCLAGLAGCSSSHPGSPATVAGTVSATLPFNPLDPNATFGATLLIEARDGSHPAASLVYGGKTYTTDASGKLVIPTVKVSDQDTGLTITAKGYLSRNVQLDYHRVGTTGMRVVLETPGIERVFSSADPASVSQGPMVLSFAANSFQTMSGAPYNGMVHLAALGIDPVASVVQMDKNGFSIRPDFDIDRIPQGYGLATGTDQSVHFLLPESLFQVQLTDDAGSPLELAKPATTTFKLSSLTFHRPGDVLPRYSFDASHQHWVADGTCTVQRQADQSLDCIGTTSHFSSWMVSSGADSTNPYCGNFTFRIKADSKYDTSTDAADPKRPIIAISSYGADAIDTPVSSPAVGPEMTSTSGACFFQRQGFAAVDLTITLTRADGSGQDTFTYELGKSGGAGSPNGYDSNLQLVNSSAIGVGDLVKSKLDTDCMGCPPSIVDVDLSSAQPVTTQTDGGVGTPSDPCSSVKCGPGAKCVGQGTCKCLDSKQRYKDSTSGCVAPTCAGDLVWDATAGACVDPCSVNNGGCDQGGVHATCENADDSVVVCSCISGYSGTGFTCTANETPPADMGAADMGVADMGLPDLGGPPAPDLGGPPAPDLGGPPAPDLGGGGGGNVSLTAGQAGTLDPGPDVAVTGGLTLGADVTYQGTFAMLTGVQVDGLSGVTEVDARVYDSGGTEVASGSNSSVSGSSAVIPLTMGYLLTPEPLRVSVWLFSGSITVFTPTSAFPYTDQSGTFSVNSAWTSSGNVIGDSYPNTSYTAIPQLTLQTQSM